MAGQGISATKHNDAPKKVKAKLAPEVAKARRKFAMARGMIGMLRAEMAECVPVTSPEKVEKFLEKFGQYGIAANSLRDQK